MSTQRLASDHFGGWALIRRLAAEGRAEGTHSGAFGDLEDDRYQGGELDAPPRYERGPRPTSFTVFEPRVRALLVQTPDMPATVLGVTAAHSRFVTARMIPTRKNQDLLLGSWELIQQLGHSVDPTVIGRMMDVAADLDRVRVRAKGRIVAEQARVWARGTTITDPAHIEVAAWLRKQFQQPRAVVGKRDDLARDLGDYDRAHSGSTTRRGSADGRHHQEHPRSGPSRSSRSPTWLLR